MGKKVFMFPGQGSQAVGMAKDLFDNSDVAKDLILTANEAAGVDLSEIMFNGPMDKLKMTDITQPAIFLHSVVLNTLIKSVKPDMVAGHSLGEYSALVAANAIDFKTATKLVRFRGQSMLQAGIDNPGTMAAVVGLPASVVEEVCQKASVEGIVQCANFNSPGQIVISGSVNGVKKGMELAKEAGAKIVKELVVSGAFHSPLMQTAKDKLKAELDAAEFNDAEIPVYANVTGKPITDKNEIKKLLFEQVTALVRWEETIKNMIEAGADEFYEVGPGKVLQGLVKRINRDVTSVGISTWEDVQKFI